MLERQPVLFLAKKLNGAEVQVQRLSDYDRSLFQRAKTKEVTSFLKNEAVRKCLSDEDPKLPELHEDELTSEVLTVIL